MRLAFALALLLAAPAGRAQERRLAFTALPVLEIPAVPEMGGATVGRATRDARAFLQNPAALALAPAGQAAAGTPDAVWFGESRTRTSAAAWSGRAGRLALGVGVAQGALSGDARTLADGTPFDPTDRYRALGASVATAGAVRVALGATARFISTTDAPVYDGARFSVGRLRGASADVGVLASADVARLAGRPAAFGLAPALDVAAGYALTHLAGTVRYTGFARQALPRTGALGWSVRAGLDLPLGGAPGRALRLVEAEAAFQGERRLVRETDTATTYDALTGGLGLRDAFTGGGSAATTGRRGVRVALAETLALSVGRFDGGGYANVVTRGVEVSAAGAFAALAQRLTPGPRARALARTDLRVGRTTVFAGTPDAATRTTITLVVGR